MYAHTRKRRMCNDCIQILHYYTPMKKGRIIKQPLKKTGQLHRKLEGLAPVHSNRQDSRDSATISCN